MLLFAVLAGTVVLLLAAEYWLHRRARERIPIRVHVNGSRGKSSVTRLIAAGLRAGGYKTWAKVTGTVPNLIDEDGNDLPIARATGPSLSEQRTVVAAAAARGVEALVLECMALQPSYQKVSQDGVLQATAGVVTNIRLDHPEVYGHELESVAHALAYTVPAGGILFTLQGPMLDRLREWARARRSKIELADPASVQDDELRRFGYLEHKENVALALAVCQHFGVPREVALRGMTAARPDPGVLRIYDMHRRGKTVHFLNAFAANDPESTEWLYHIWISGRRWRCPVLIIVNARPDRPLRSRQMGALLTQLHWDRAFLVGQGADLVQDAARAAGTPAHKLVLLGRPPLQGLVSTLFDYTAQESVIFGIGNTAGLGLALSDHFRTKGRPSQLPPKVPSRQVPHA